MAKNKTTMQETFFYQICWAWIALALLLVPVQLKITAPYGRHADHRWGLQMPYRPGWVLMEIVSPLTLAFFLFFGKNDMTAPTWVIVLLWAGHYANRSLVYPFRARMRGKNVPVAVVASAVFFNLVNGGLNGYYLGNLAEKYSSDWFSAPCFIVGTAVFLTGAAINIRSDNALRRLRRPGEMGYKIPSGSLFRHISCPNHFGEIIEWAGFAILCWNLPALSFAIWTAANLIPRSLSHHRWYKEKFEDYPPERKAVIPGVF